MIRREQLGPEVMRQEQTPEALLKTQALVWYSRMSEREGFDVGEEEEGSGNSGNSNLGAHPSLEYSLPSYPHFGL